MSPGNSDPRIDPQNSLRFPLREIGDRDRVDLVLTNPPFGGEEEKGILGNFPEDMQTAETALLFLQLIMRKLKRPGQASETGGRAAVVVPNGTLFADGIAARIKEALCKHFNLHTIVRLPEGVFAPYTDIPANLLFFDRSGPTHDIWFYQIPPPEGCKKYTKTKPMEYAEFDACLAWWNNREENANAWKIPFAEQLADALTKARPHWDAAEQAKQQASALEKQLKEQERQLADLKRAKADNEALSHAEKQRADLLARVADKRQRQRDEQARGDGIYWPLLNLDIKNPSSLEALEHRAPEELIAGIFKRYEITANGIESVTALGEVAQQLDRFEQVLPDAEYRLLGMRSKIGGPFLRETKKGDQTSAQKLNRVQSGDFIS